MALTSIGSQKTPGRPIELTFAAETGLPSDATVLLLIGHRATGASSGSVADYAAVTISNSGDKTAASGEAATKFGQGSELQKMIVSAIQALAGLGTVPTIKAIPLQYADTGFGASDEALTSAEKVSYNFAVSPYDGNDATTRNKLKNHILLVSGAQRVENNQFGSFGVVANQSVSDPSLLPLFDSQYIIGVWMRDSAPVKSLGELAAMAAAQLAANAVPYYPVDSQTIPNLDAPVNETDNITVGAGLNSEICLGQGWTPLYTKPNGEVAFVRAVTGRISADGSGTPIVGAYYDVQDFQVLYFWRKTLFTRFSQPDMKKKKASSQKADEIKSEMLRLANLFQIQEMFQAVEQLAKSFVVERNASDRHRFDYKTPVNVIPGLHVIAGNIEATTQFDSITI